MTITQLNEMLAGLEKNGSVKGAGYDSTTTSHPSASLDDNTSPAPKPGVVAAEYSKDLKEQSPSEKPVDSMSDATPAKTTEMANPVDAKSYAVGSGPTTPSKTTKDDPGTSLPNAEAGTEKYATLSTSDLKSRFKSAADAGLAALLKSAAEPAKTGDATTTAQPTTTESVAAAATKEGSSTPATTTQDAASAGYAASADAGKVQKLAAARALIQNGLTDTLWMAEKTAALLKKASLDMGMGGEPPMPVDPGAAGGGPPSGAPMGGPPMGGPPAGGPPAGAPPMDPAAAGAGGGNPDQALDELISAIFEAGFSPDQVLAAVQRSAGGAGGDPMAGAGGPPPSAPPGGGGDSGGGESKPKKEESKEPAESDSKEEKEAAENDVRLAKAAVARWKSGNFRPVPLDGKDTKSAARREQMRQAIRDIMGN